MQLLTHVGMRFVLLTGHSCMGAHVGTAVLPAPQTLALQLVLPDLPCACTMD